MALRYFLGSPLSSLPYSHSLLRNGPTHDARTPKPVSFDLPLMLVNGLAEGKVAVKVHDLVLVGVVVVLGRAVWHNAFDLVGFAGAKDTRLYSITVRGLLNRDLNIVSKASAYGEVRRDVQRRNVGIDTLFLRDIQALGGSRSDIGIGISVARRYVSCMVILPVASQWSATR